MTATIQRVWHSAEDIMERSIDKLVSARLINEGQRAAARDALDQVLGYEVRRLRDAMEEVRSEVRDKSRLGDSQETEAKMDRINAQIGGLLGAAPGDPSPEDSRD